MKTYGVVSIFETIQGEGYHAGTPAVFLRLAGCNMWSGVHALRVADAARTGALCPIFCDTNFKVRERLTAAQILERIASFSAKPLIVITGGEPLLQLDDELILALRHLPGMLAIETNGTVKPLFTPWARLWLTLAPKLNRGATAIDRADELKLVWPACDPDDWATFPAHHRFLQPQADMGYRSHDHERALVEYLGNHPDWRLSLQQHKILGIP